MVLGVLTGWLERRERGAIRSTSRVLRVDPSRLPRAGARARSCSRLVGRPRGPARLRLCSVRRSLSRKLLALDREWMSIGRIAGTDGRLDLRVKSRDRLRAVRPRATRTDLEQIRQ